MPAHPCGIYGGYVLEGPAGRDPPAPDPHGDRQGLVLMNHRPAGASCRAVPARPRSTLEVTMNNARLSLLASSVLVVPLALAIGAAGPAAAEPPSTTFGSHVSVCAQTSPGFSGQHNPGHHRGPTATHGMTDMHRTSDLVAGSTE